MNFNEIQELIKLISKSNLTEFKLKDKDFEFQVRTNKYKSKTVQTVVSAPQSAFPTMATPAVAPQAPAAPLAPAAAKPMEQSAKADPKPAKNLMEIKSPIVGTFYRSSSPDKPPFVKVGDTIKQGDVVCIIEAMKLFNEIESDFSGTIVKVLIEDASPVEYDQVLFLVEV